MASLVEARHIAKQCNYVAIQRKVMQADNAYLLFKKDGGIIFVFYGNCDVGSYHLDCADLDAMDWVPYNQVPDEVLHKFGYK